MILCAASLAGERLHHNLNFKITKAILKTSDIHYSYGEFEKNRFSKKDVSSFDVEGLSAQNNSRIFFSKSVFVLNKRVEDIDTSIFKNTTVIKGIMGATVLTRTAPGKTVWNSSMPIYIYDVKSQLEVKQVNFDNLENDIFMDYFLAADTLDQNLPKSEYQVHIRLTKFNMGFDRMMVVCNFSSLAPKTVVACYVIAKANNSWWKNRNIFSIASKRMKKIIKKVLFDTRMILQ